MNDILYVVMPAYNEEANIEKTVKEWYGVLDGKADSSRLVVADSGSTDNTHRILEGMQEKYPGLIILSDTLKQHGPKLIALYTYAIENGADYVFQTDSDGQTNPNEFEAFWTERENREAILGWRKQRGDGFGRLLVEKVLCAVVYLMFKVRIPDANAPFRLMKADVLKKYIERFEPDYNLPNVMLAVFYKYYNHRLEFKQISFENRKGGKNSINLVKIVSIGGRALSRFRKFAKNM